MGQGEEYRESECSPTPGRERNQPLHWRLEEEPETNLEGDTGEF